MFTLYVGEVGIRLVSLMGLFVIVSFVEAYSLSATPNQKTFCSFPLTITLHKPFLVNTLRLCINSFRKEIDTT